MGPPDGMPKETILGIFRADRLDEHGEGKKWQWDWEFQGIAYGDSLKECTFLNLAA